MAPGSPLDGRVRRGQESREARRAQIKERALVVFGEQGYHATSVSDLVAAAGVARGTFYLYFDSKDAIFVELLDDLVRHLRSNIVGVDVSEGAPPMEEQLKATVVRIFDTVVSNRSLTRIVFREAIGLHEAVDQRMRRFDDELHTYVARSLRLAHASGTLRSLDARVSAACIVGSVREVVNRYVVASDADFDRDAVAGALLDHHLRGLQPFAPSADLG
ncbi:MAG: TetR/AcrR family transcriptional regulator [Myxococcales bacterium]|nr:TetR/AcrR family transcriptional regulator [Myxococcales bacterium]